MQPAHSEEVPTTYSTPLELRESPAQKCFFVHPSTPLPAHGSTPPLRQIFSHAHLPCHCAELAGEEPLTSIPQSSRAGSGGREGSAGEPWGAWRNLDRQVLLPAWPPPRAFPSGAHSPLKPHAEAARPVWPFLSTWLPQPRPRPAAGEPAGQTVRNLTAPDLSPTVPWAPSPPLTLHPQ